MKSKWAAVRIGLLNSGDIEDVVISDCIFHDTLCSGFKIQAADSGRIHDVLMSNIIMRNVTRPIFVTSNFCKMGVLEESARDSSKGIDGLYFKNIIIAGGIGGRLDHTIANIQSLAYAFEQGADIKMIDENNIVFILENNKIEIEKYKGWKLSIFALRPKCKGVSLYNVKYPLDNVILTDSFPLGISNEFKEGKAKIECTDGRLLIIITKCE